MPVRPRFEQEFNSDPRLGKSFALDGAEASRDLVNLSEAA